MIKLSKRLCEIASLIDSNDNVLDIGCDHALLDIYLSKKYSKVYYASDLRESALDMARTNIKKYNANNVILKCGNGLDVIDKNIVVDTIVISGMGYLTIKHILRNIKKMKDINKLVIQSNSNSEIVRKFMLKNGFYIEKEVIVLDKNIYYIISSFKRGKRKYNSMQREIGLFSIKDSEKYIDIEIKKQKILLSLIPKREILKRYKVKRRLKYLNKKKNSISI